MPVNKTVLGMARVSVLCAGVAASHLPALTAVPTVEACSACTTSSFCQDGNIVQGYQACFIAFGFCENLGDRCSS